MKLRGVPLALNSLVTAAAALAVASPKEFGYGVYLIFPRALGLLST